MLFCLVFAFIGAVPGQAVFKTDHVHVCVNIQSSVYTYKLTNLTSSPIVGFEVKQHAGHGFKVPKDWQQEISQANFKAWTSIPRTGIHKNSTAEFSFNVSTKGAVLGRSPVKVLFKSGESVTLFDVWASSKEPPNYIALVAGLILVILLLHSVIVARKNRRGENSIS